MKKDAFKSNFFHNARGFAPLFCAAFFIVTAFAYPNPSFASNPDNLKALAKSFLAKIGPVYEEKEVFNPMDQIPDGSTLLLRPRANKVVFGDDIYALKKDGMVYVAFEDVIDILEFAIDFKEGGQVAEGWFLREDWQIKFDRPAGEVISKGVTYKLSPDDTYEKDGLLYVRGDALGQWLDIKFDYDVSQQFLDIATQYPLPAVGRFLRSKRGGKNTRNYAKQAELPRLEQEKAMFDINTADVNMGLNYQKLPNGDTNTIKTGNVAAEGEVLKHNAYAFASADSNNNLVSVVSRLTKRSENDDLLGPLNARAYGVGDVDITSIPLTGAVNQDLGFRFDNKPFENSDFARTNIEGDALPGWDIELYRNGVLIETLTVDQNGRYVFSDIDLFIDDNDFELYFFGPQGQIRVEEVTVPVSAELLNAQNKTYEVSLSLEESQTYQGLKAEDEDENTPHIAARYNRLIGDNNLGYVGVRSRQIDGDRKTYLSSGLSSIIGKTYVDTNFAADQEANLAAEIIARRNIFDWDTSARAQVNTDEYITSSIVDPETLNLSLNAQRNFTGFKGFNSSVLANSNYRETAAGSVIKTGNFGVSNKILGANVSNQLRYEDNDIVGINDPFGFNTTNGERLDHNFSVRKNFQKTFLRLGSTYGIKPEKGLRSLVAQANYQHNSKLSADIALDRQVQTKLDTIRLNANYTHDKIRTSPYVRLDSDHQLYAGVNVNFNLTEAPGSVLPQISSRRQTYRGMVSAFVYHDKNGNFIYDGDDEPIPDAVVNSINIGKRATTDQSGFALLRELTTTKPTDITLDRETLPDPFMVVGTEGKSVLPEPGTIYEMEFPVHLSGEVEGNIFFRDTDGSSKPLSFVDVSLVSLDHPDREPLTVRSASDGFYLSFLVPPGRYLIVPEGKKNSQGQFGNPMPQEITIGYEGTILQDVDIELERGKATVPYSVKFVQAPSDIQGAGLGHYLKVKAGGMSDLSQMLAQLIQKKFAGNILKNLRKVSDENADEENYDLYASPNMNPAQIHQSCADLQSKGIECEVIVSVTLGNGGNKIAKAGL